MATPLTLIILDGWGYSESTEANAIYAAKTPHWDQLWAQCPHSLIQGSGGHVGLPEGQMGNSEVGHLNIGSGRVVYQDYTRIEKAIENKEFFGNSALVAAIDKAVNTDHAVHVMGLLSPGGVHSHENHIFALLRMAQQRGAKKIYLHAFLDGRDTPPRSATASLKAAQAQLDALGCGEIASVCGRFYAMDRDNRWDRIQKAYDMLTQADVDYHYEDALQALDAAYARDENDEFVSPSCIHKTDTAPISINDGDALIFMNYRADRAREISRCFTETDFDGFTRKKCVTLASFTSLTQYASDIDANVAFPPIHLENTLGAYLSQLGLKQLRIAETEKYAHVTFFFNGGVEQPFAGEERILIPSPDVKTYDLQPEMSAPELTDKLITAIQADNYDVIICNFANPDMVGHTGNFDATVKAIEAIDTCLGRIHQALQDAGGELLVTADHGNAEKMVDPSTQQAHTAHTCEPVPLIFSGRSATFSRQDGKLSDLAPTMLSLLGKPIPKEMTGNVLLELT